MSNSTTLVRSTMLVAVAGVTFFATNADAGIYVNDYATFAADATAGGLAQQYVETFEENTWGGAYQILDHPLTYGVPNQSFATGLNAPGLTVDTDDLGVNLDLFTGPGNPYFSNLTSDGVGPNNTSGAMVAWFDGGMSAVALEVISLTQFIGGAFDELNYRVYDTGDVLIDSGNLTLDGTIYNSLGFYYDGSDIGRFELEGFRLGLASAEVLDNIEGWAVVPAPGALALLGLAGLARRRRRD